MIKLNIMEAAALTSPNPLTLVCSQNEDGTTNLTPVCFVSYLSFNPPMIGFVAGKQSHTGKRGREIGKVTVTVPGGARPRPWWPAVVPGIEWVWHLTHQAHALGIPAFIKEELLPIMGEEQLMQELLMAFCKVLEEQSKWQK